MVIPCSRSARRPSVSRARSSAAVVAVADRTDLVFVDALRVVEQAADQGGLAVVDAAGGGEAEQILGSFGCEKASIDECRVDRRLRSNASLAGI